MPRLRRLQECGILLQLEEKYMDWLVDGSYSCGDEVSGEAHSLTISDIWAGFLVLAVGLPLAIATLLWEVAKGKSKSGDSRLQTVKEMEANARISYGDTKQKHPVPWEDEKEEKTSLNTQNTIESLYNTNIFRQRYSVTRPWRRGMQCPLWVDKIDGLVQERRNYIANALELRLFCTRSSKLCISCTCHCHAIYNIVLWQCYKEVRMYLILPKGGRQ